MALNSGELTNLGFGGVLHESSMFILVDLRVVTLTRERASVEYSNSYEMAWNYEFNSTKISHHN